jgi:hypothetical protein
MQHSAGLTSASRRQFSLTPGVCSGHFSASHAGNSFDASDNPVDGYALELMETM